MAPTLNADEVGALMSAIQDGKVASQKTAPRSNVATYDLTSQDRIIRGQLPTLDAINDRVGSLFATGLVGRTRLAIRVNAAPATLLKLSDLTPMLAPPATVAVLSLGTSKEQGLLVLEPGMADLLLSAAMGDRRKSNQAEGEAPPTAEGRRELTAVEQQVLRRLLSFFTAPLATAWAPVLPLNPELLRFEVDPRLATIGPPNEAAVLCSFDLTGGLTGRIQLAFPYSVVEPVRKQLASPPRLNSGADKRFTNALSAELEQVELEVRVQLGVAQLSVSRLLDLAEGDVLTLGTSEGSLLPILVEGRAKFCGTPKVVGGAMAVVVEPPPDRSAFLGHGTPSLSTPRALPAGNKP